MSDPEQTRTKVPLELHYDVSSWLTWEAELLDGHRYRDWLSLLHEEVSYRMPVTVTASRGDGAGKLLGKMDHWEEDLYSLTKRVERLEGDHAWTENPPSRTRRFVTNMRVVGPTAAGEVEVRSYVLLFRSRGDLRDADLVSAERADVLARRGGDWCLRRRTITVDEAVLHTQNLALLL